MSKNICPVCNYDGLSEPPYNNSGDGSYEICRCCGFQFGYRDYGKNGYKDKNILILHWRSMWIDSGYIWHSRATKPPLGWDGKKQLEDGNMHLSTEQKEQLQEFLLQY